MDVYVVTELEYESWVRGRHNDRSMGRKDQSSV